MRYVASEQELARLEEMVSIVKSFLSGKVVQCHYLGKWCDLKTEPSLVWNSTNYRIKPEPHYRAYQNLEEAKHILDMEIKSADLACSIVGVGNQGVFLSVNHSFVPFEQLFKFYKTAKDNLILGVLIG